MKSNRSAAILSAAILLCLILVVAGFQLDWFQRETVNQLPEEQKQTIGSRSPERLSEVLGVPEEDLVEVGGVRRPSRDLAFEKSTREAKTSSKSWFPNPGQAPAVKSDSNSQVAGLFQELTSDEPPLAARSSLFPPEPFDSDVYEADRQAWLEKIRPGRAFQPAQAAPDIQPITATSGIFQNVLQGEQVFLEAKVEPGAPVTFYTPQVGEFPNRLTTHSVAADENGIAKTVYTAGSGSLGIIDILAASPLNSGQLRFRVRVALPKN